MNPRPVFSFRPLCRALAWATAGIAAASSAFAQNPAVFVNLSTTQASTAGVTPTSAATFTIAAPGSGWIYGAAAPYAGETWNNILSPHANDQIKPQSLGLTQGAVVALITANNIALTQPDGSASGVTLTASAILDDAATATNTREVPRLVNVASATPSGLMGTCWRIFEGGNRIGFVFSGLPVNAHYVVYGYASTNAVNQGARFTLVDGNAVGAKWFETNPAANATPSIFVLNAGALSPSTPAPLEVASNAAGGANANTTWSVLHAKVDSAGKIEIRASRNANNNGFPNGLQLIPYPKATITTQPSANASGTVGDGVTLNVAASGFNASDVVTYQWRKGGVAINAVSNPSAATASLTLSNLQNGDAGNYDVVVTNYGGDAISSATVLTVTSGAVAPSILTQPVARTALTGGNASFSVSANGTSPLTYTWQKSTTGATTGFADIPASNSATLALTGVTVADAGFYRVRVQNSVTTVTSDAVSLIVAPVITAQPSGAVVAVGSTATLTVGVDAGVGAPEATTYVWKRDGVVVTNGSGISGATSAALQVTGFSAAQSGYYALTASNSAGSVTSSIVYAGVPSTQVATFAPGNNATGIAIDQQLRLVFPSAPKLGRSGQFRVHDASNDAVVTTVDLSEFVSFTLFSATIVNSKIQTLQGKQMYYLPAAIYGNEVWITLPAAQRLAYGKTYYVTMDAGFLLDSSNASVPAITSATAWRFSTKASGPATPTASTGPTEITVSAANTGDFATLQGAIDWVPQNNTLPRTIRVQPGLYRDTAYFAQNRHFVTLVGTGPSRTDAKIIYHYGNEVYGAGARGLGGLRIDTNDVTVRNLTFDNEVYLAVPSLAGGSNPGAPAFAGPVQTVASTGLRLVFDNVLMKGGQDTLYTISGIGYFKNCEIWGSVDFIYGDALAVFDSCDIVQIRDTGGPICAPSTPYAQPYGEVFLNCRFPRALVANGYPYNVNAGSTTFCRPWRQDGHVAIINSQLDTHITTKGWGEWDGRENTMRAREYGNTLIAGGPAPTAAQRLAAGGYWVNTFDPDYTSSSMSPTDALLAAPNGIINRQPVTVNPADYTLAAIFGHPYFALNGWLPTAPNVAPVFSTHPTAQTINTGASVTFTAAASGSPTYQWKKDGTDIPGAVAAAYTVSNATTGSAGSYTVVATNGAGSATSNAAVLTVNVVAGPAITAQPSAQTVTVGTAVNFTVAATGTGTLTYQWQKEIGGVFTNVPYLFAENDPAIVTDLSGIATATLSFVHAQVINAGNYRVLVTDSNGTTASNTVAFIVNAAPVGALTFDGFAASVTGGGSLTPVVVTTAAELRSAAESTSAAVITVSGVIDLGTNGRINVKSNKTIRGADTGATIIGSLAVSGVTNVIVANLNVTARTGGRASNDGLTVGSGSTNVLITKCTFFDCTDGNLDVTNGSDNVTVSWCKFYYTRNTTHNFSNLIGSSDTDVATSPYRTTWHHNWWGPGCKQRMLACRFGGAHMFNNYWSCTGNDYCSTSRNIAQMLSEYNVYSSVKDPLAKEGSATLKTIGNVFTNCTGLQATSNDTVFTPPYAYRVDRTADIQTLVTAGAGNSGTAAHAAESLAITGATSVATGGSITLTASGYVSYQWRFNNEAIAGATSATHTIASAQSANAGVYTVVGGFSGRPDSVVSTPHALTVTTAPVAVPPSITTQPASQSAAIGAAASFTVVATGDAPLTYQWQTNSSGAFANISGAMSATLNITAAQWADAAGYRVIVTNGAGTATSSTVTLTVSQPGFAVTAPDGFANVATGGGSATPVTVTTAAALKTAAESTSPAVITVSGVINLSSSGGNIRVKSNKTIQGADANATIIGNINIGSGVENVILRGLNLTNPGTILGTDGRYTDGGDAVAIEGARNVFITHCTLFDCADGMIDTRLGADLVTISWCEFYYTAAQLDHRFTMISDGLLNRDPITDAVISAGAPLRITMHHNWWSDRCDQRMPSSTNGHIHLYNNYWNTPGNSYASVARDMAQFFAEHNTYENVNSPLAKSDNNALLANGLIRAIGNRYVNITGTVVDPGTDAVFVPAYSYKLQPVTSTAGLDVKTLVLAHAGNIAGLNSVSPAALTATITSPRDSLPLPPGSGAGGVTTWQPSAGSFFSLTASFTGFTAASYQWRVNNFLITGATSATYEIPSMGQANTGTYTVAITLANGETVISAPRVTTLDPLIAPSITTQPANVTVTAGASASFSVVATGSPAPTYQWRKGGVSITGATSASYSIAATAAADAGQYTVVVTNDGGSVTSNAATLTVNAVPSTTPPSGGGGGGSPSLWFVSALALLAVARRGFSRRASRGAST
ncbi:pectinesterase family protein [Nibricoccus aquaticus]|nr:pectinesterase family protein [Nibricoccus aquaticus]